MPVRCRPNAQKLTAPPLQTPGGKAGQRRSPSDGRRMPLISRAMSGWIGSQWPLSALGRWKRPAGMASAFEKRRIDPDRPECALRRPSCEF